MGGFGCLKGILRVAHKMGESFIISTHHLIITTNGTYEGEF